MLYGRGRLFNNLNLYFVCKFVLSCDYYLCAGLDTLYNLVFVIHATAENYLLVIYFAVVVNIYEVVAATQLLDYSLVKGDTFTCSV